eukprot:SAG25_NODE_185_length_12423_cov_283.570432_2_plen_74_part_00
MLTLHRRLAFHERTDLTFRRWLHIRGGLLDILPHGSKQRVTTTEGTNAILDGAQKRILCGCEAGYEDTLNMFL